MDIYTIDASDALWLPLAAYAQTRSWDACARMAASMRAGRFSDWERVIIAQEQGEFMGFCALLKPQAFPGEAYSPLIKWLFVDEAYRGRRISQALLEAAAAHAKSLGFTHIYLTTWHAGLYERYGFAKLCEMEARNGYSEGVYAKPV